MFQVVVFAENLKPFFWFSVLAFWEELGMEVLLFNIKRDEKYVGIIWRIALEI